MGAVYGSSMKSEWPESIGFDWDDGNRDKNLKHGVHGWECEQVLFNEPLVTVDDAKHSAVEKRYVAFGQTDAGRRLILIYTMRSGLVRVISARDMNKRERQYYENLEQN